ncbi:hypothetical protein FCM35_KLT18232 [Carex littledalei]|uniref:Uncharacterized protein n=1 Tax=Carex littledalei TaxID=544730 RepID=A0A833R338_9POAL|nr:hypothetical protein FCM35_KLT18232 [Carex littledalei]
MTQSARPVLLTYKKKKPLPLFPSPTSQQLSKRIRDVPDLSLCHCCGLNYQNPNPNRTSNPIHILKSAWRILLLCETCLTQTKSGEICSYCLQIKPDDVAIDDMSKLESLNCLKCSRRVHFCCIPREHRYDFATWQKLGKAGNDRSFTCIDCSPVPKLLVRNKKLSALGLIGEEKVADVATGDLLTKRVDDKDLAIQLHLQMNGSRRVTRKKVHSGLLSGPSIAKRGKIELYRQRLSVGSIGVKNSRMINARFSGISFGHNSVVLAVASSKCLFEPLSELRERCRFSKKYSKRKDLQNGNDDSKLDRQNGRDRYEKKYVKKKEALSTTSGTCSESHSVTDRYQKKHAKGNSLVATNSGGQNRSNRYGYKYYKRRSCLEKLGDSNVTDNGFDHDVGLKQNISDQCFNKYFKRRLSVKREDGTCVGTCTVYDQNVSDRYFKKYTKTRKREAGTGESSVTLTAT